MSHLFLREALGTGGRSTRPNESLLQKKGTLPMHIELSQSRHRHRERAYAAVEFALMHSFNASVRLSSRKVRLDLHARGADKRD